MIIKKELINNDKGEMGFKHYFALAIFCGTIYFILYPILNFYYSYWAIGDMVKQESDRAQILSDVEIKDNLFHRVKELGIPLSEEQIYVQREGEKLKIQFKYSEVLYFTILDKDYDLHTFHYEIDTEKKIQEASGRRL